MPEQRMRKVGIGELTGTVYLSEPVFLDSGFILTSPDIPITHETYNRLAAWGFKSVFTAGEIVSEPPVHESDGPATSPEITRSYEDEQAKKQAIEFFGRAVQFVEEAFERFREKDELRLVSCTEVVKEITAELKSNRRFLFTLEDTDAKSSSYLTTHAVKTTILTLALADYLKIPPYRQIDLGIAALMHEIGLLKIPEELYLSDRKLTPQEKQTLLAHPVLGYRLLKASDFPQPACVAVLEQNERLDGSGFPRRVTGEKISEFGRILAVAISYTAATSKRPYKAGTDGHSGLMDLIRDPGKRYDEKVLGALVYTLSLYPIGTYVRMNNGAIGIVVKANDDDPKHPAIKLIIDESGNRYAEQPVVQTRDGDEITIDSSLTKEELKQITARRS